MWKLAAGFIALAALAIYILTKSGGDIDLGGEKHGDTAAAAEPASSSAQPAAGAASKP